MRILKKLTMLFIRNSLFDKNCFANSTSTLQPVANLSKQTTNCFTFRFLRFYYVSTVSTTTTMQEYENVSPTVPSMEDCWLMAFYFVSFALFI